MSGEARPVPRAQLPAGTTCILTAGGSPPDAETLVLAERFKRYLAARNAAGLAHNDPDTPETERLADLNADDTTPEPDTAARLAQIRDRSARLAAIPMETAAGHHVMRDMIDSIGDVRWLLEQLKPQHGVQREGSQGASPARDEASAREQADMYSRVHEPGCLPTPYHVVQRYVTDWQRVDDEQQAEDGDHG